MVVKSAAMSVCSELGEGEVSQKWTANGAISAVLVRDFGRVTTIRVESCLTLTRIGLESHAAVIPIIDTNRGWGILGQKGNSR